MKGRKYDLKIASTDPPPPEQPSKAELSFDSLRLARSIDARLDQSDWLFSGEWETKQPGRLLLAASLRHAVRLLLELDIADIAGLTFATRMVARTLYETLTLTVYLAFFSDRGYDLVRSNFRAHVKDAISAVDKLNEMTAADANAESWKRVPPPVSTKSLEQLLDGLGASNTKLPLDTMIREISSADVAQGFFRENLRRLHLIWRATSMFAPHTNYWVLKGYFSVETGDVVVPTLREFSGHDTSRIDRVFSMHMTACVAVAVLQSDTEPMKVAHEIVEKYKRFVGSEY